MSGPEQLPAGFGQGLWEALGDSLRQGKFEAGLDLLAAGYPIVYAHHDRDDCVIREYPDGRRELVRYDADGEHILGPLPAVEPRV